MAKQLLQLMDSGVAQSPKDKVSLFFLRLASFLYAAAVQLILMLYQIGFLRKQSLPRPVISVGNVTWGGTGKTPLVIWLGRYLQSKNKKAAILTRGYMAGSTDGLSDETQILSEELNLPVLTGADRIQSAARAMAVKPDLFILDDGFQQWKLKKDLDIVVIDATRPFGNRQLLPAGILREPLSSLKRADLFVLTKTDQAWANLPAVVSELKKIKSGAPILDSIHRPRVWLNLSTQNEMDLKEIQGKRVLAFCSIARPESFRNLLSALDANVSQLLAFRDHHVYQEADLLNIRKAAGSDKVNILVTTQKDAVKIKPYLHCLAEPFQVYCLLIDLQFIKGEHELTQRIDRLL